MKKRTFGVPAAAMAIGAVVVFLAGTGETLAAEGAAERTISVSATATASASPDRVKLGVSIVTRASTASTAASENAKRAGAVLKRLEDAVAGAGEVATGSYSLSAEYEYVKTGNRQQRKLKGYVARNEIRVTSSNLDGAGALIDAAVASGANEIGAIQFVLADDTVAKRQATLEAGRRARIEAETVAESLGVGLGALLEARTGYRSPPAPSPRLRQASMEASSAAPTPVAPGAIDVVATVSVIFSIR